MSYLCSFFVLGFSSLVCILATFYVLTRHMWVVGTPLGSADLDSNFLITLGDLGMAAGVGDNGDEFICTNTFPETTRNKSTASIS